MLEPHLAVKKKKKNPLTEKLIKNAKKDKIILLNKSDLALEREILKWKAFFESVGNNDN